MNVNGYVRKQRCYGSHQTKLVPRGGGFVVYPGWSAEVPHIGVMRLMIGTGFGLQLAFRSVHGFWDLKFGLIQQNFGGVLSKLKSNFGPTCEPDFWLTLFLIISMLLDFLSEVR